VGTKTIHLNRDPKPYEKITRHVVENVPGLFKTYFQGGQSLESETTEKATIFDVKLMFLLQEIKAYPLG
jgi:hypothetical protein